MTERELDDIYQQAKREALASLGAGASRLETWTRFTDRLDLIGRRIIGEREVLEAKPPKPIVK